MYSSSTPTTEASPREYRSRYTVDDTISLSSSTSPARDGFSETSSFVIYNPSLASSQTSIASYKTEKSIVSRKSRYNALPRHKYAGLEHLRSPLGPVSSDVEDLVEDASAFEVRRIIKCQSNHNDTSIILQSNLRDKSGDATNMSAMAERDVVPGPEAGTAQHLVPSTSMITENNTTFDDILKARGKSVPTGS